MLPGYVRSRSYVKKLEEKSVLTTQMTSIFSYVTLIAAQSELHPSVYTVLRDSETNLLPS
jgi:hypothetical protein